MRDLRAPLVAGYLWLVAVWIAVGPTIPVAEHASGPIATSIVDLAQTAGPAATAAGVSVMAYIAGAISVSLPGVLARAMAPPVLTVGGFSLELPEPASVTDELTGSAPSQLSAGTLHRLRWPFRRWLWRMLPRRLSSVTLARGLYSDSSEELLGELQRQEARRDPERVDDAQPMPRQDAAAIRSALWNRVSGLLHGVVVTPPTLMDTRETLEDRWPQLSATQIAAVLRRADTLAAELERELDLPNTLLVGDQPEIYAEADRARAEADFRLALVLPALALVVVLAITGGWWWLVGLLAPAALLTTGLAKKDEARTFVRNSIQSGKTPSPAAQRFVDFVSRRIIADTAGA